MSDLGETYPSTGPMPSCGCDECVGKETKDKKHYPRIDFTTVQMPDLSGVTVGDEVTLVIKGKVCRVSEGEEYLAEDENTQTRVTIKMIDGSAKVSESTEDPEIAAMSKKKSAMDELMNDDGGTEKKDEKPDAEA